MEDTMKKYSIYLIVLMLILSLFVFASCTPAEEPEQSDDLGTTEPIPEETEPAPAELKFSENKTCEFYIVYPEDFSAEVKDIAIELRKQIKKYTGVEIKIVGDRILDKPIGDSGVEHQYEILLGPTKREASQKALSGMRSRDYTVTFDGDKIVLLGTTIDTVEKASDRFINDVLIKQGKNDQGNATIIMTEANILAYTYKKYSIGSCTLLGSDLSEFRIVYSKSDLYSAERNARLFAYELARDAGYVLDLAAVTTADKENRKEIVFGDTAHGGEKVTTKHGYTVKASGNKLYVSAECLEGYRELLKYLTGTLFKGESVTIEEGFTYSGVAVPELAEDIETRAGEYRVIFNNIYGSHQAEHPAETRNLMQAELHLEYMPDVIGLQESSDKVTSYHAFMKRHGYTGVPSKPNNSNAHDYTAMLYRADKLELLECGYHLYDDGAGDKSKAVTWAVFKDKATGDVFAVGSTHFYWKSDELGQSARLKDAAQLTEVAKKITSKYNCPFIVGGDYNCNINSEPFKILNNEGFLNFQKISPDTMDSTTHHSYSAYDESLRLYLVPQIPTNPYSKAIDHALLYNQSTLAAKKFRVILDDYSFLSSDHCPVMVDFDIN